MIETKKLPRQNDEYDATTNYSDRPSLVNSYEEKGVLLFNIYHKINKKRNNYQLSEKNIVALRSYYTLFTNLVLYIFSGRSHIKG